MNGNYKKRLSSNVSLFSQTSQRRLQPFYNQKKAKYKKIKEFLKEKAERSKQAYELVSDEESDIEVIPIVQEKYIDDIRKHASKIVLSPMITSWEVKIQHLIPKKLRKHYSEQLKILFESCKSDWNDCLHALIVKRIVKDNTPKAEQVEKKSQVGGRTENYHIFVRTKHLLKEKLLVTHPFMRKVLDTSVTTFPKYIVDLSLYRNRGLLDIKTLRDTFNDELVKSENVIINEWYKPLVSYFKLNPSINILPVKKHNDLYSCLAHSISMQVEELMRRSIENIIEVVGELDKIPFIFMELKFNGDIYLEPSLDEIYAVYNNMMISITSICRNLPHFIQKSGYLKIEINSWVFENSHTRLQEKLHSAFRSILEYIETLKDEFSELIVDFSNSATVEITHEKIKLYRVMREKLAVMVKSEYFPIGRIDQSDMIENLSNCSSVLRANILNTMRNAHRMEVDGICAEFEEIAARALATPKDAAELMASGAYCLHVKTILIDELQEKISKSIVTMSQLIDLTTLSDNHIKMNTKMINWLQDIQPILERNAVNHEAIKYDMEENLMTKTNDLGKKINDLLPYLEILDNMDNINNTFSYLEDLRKLVFWINDCDGDLAWINQEEAVFKFPLSQYNELDELKDYILPFYDLMYLLHRWRRSYFSWMDGPFQNIKSSQVEQQHEEYYKEFTQIQKQYKNKIKQQISDGNERRFKGLVEDPDPMNLPAPMKLCAQALNELNEWRPYVQLVKIMCNSALRQRHWDEMSEIAGFDLTPDAGTTIRKLIKLDLWPDLEKYEIISVGACKELTLSTDLNNMITEWDNINFTVEFCDGVKVLTNLDDIRVVFDDQIVKTTAMRGSAFVKPFEREVKEWYEKLMRINEITIKWKKIQTQGIFLMPLFSFKDVKSEIPTESGLFQRIQRVYNDYVLKIENVPLVIETGSSQALLEGLEDVIRSLSDVNKGIVTYIEKKQFSFPRFYFLSDDEILTILVKTKNSEDLQSFIQKCFEGISKLEIDSNSDLIGFHSDEGENVQFCEVISSGEFQGTVDNWLVNIEKELFRTINQEFKMSIADYSETSREDWIKKWEGMIVLCVSQIYWTAEIHDCLRSGKNLELFYKKISEELEQFVSMIRASNLENVHRITIKTLIVIGSHVKDTVNELIDKNVSNENDFNWLAQLKYYWEDSKVLVRIINASIKYGYEYLGNTERLVITPLTSRCYRTLIGAYDLHLNGATEGPAGTGKTETIKDLAKALAKKCVVFNCSDDLDYKSMGKFFKGIATCGAWTCFDELNRVNVEVLSVVAQQIHCIIQAIKRNANTFQFEGMALTLNPTCFVCITMNPGYAGRSELPDNLKVLFRTVAMMVPDYRFISEISLLSYGFLKSRELAMKIVNVHRLCAEQLFLQNHYDYGMRTVKAVLLACEKNKMKYPNENENALLFRSIMDVNLPKLLSDEVCQFNSLISDIFPDTELISKHHPEIGYEVEKYCNENNLQPTEYFVSKLMETYDMMLIRYGLMLIGNTYSGKTTILRTLANVLSSLNDKGLNYKPVKYTVINPKTLDASQLFCTYDSAANEWIDGVVASAFKEYFKDQSESRKWIVFDGPIDAVWIENMNTVLDDNKRLCLTSGEIITISKDTSIIFEVTGISQASPATISRCGMIFTESNRLGIDPFIKSWLKGSCSRWKNGYEEYISDLCEWLFPQLLLIMDQLEEPEMTGGYINLATTTLKLINMLMTDAVTLDDDPKYVKNWIQASFIFSIMWGFGGNLNAESKKKFDELFRDVWKNERNLPEKLEKMDVSLPSEGLLYDYVYQYKQKGSWKHWQEIVKNVKINETASLQHLLIPTVETVKYTFLLDLHVRYKVPMLFHGPSGTGKTFCAQKYILNQLSINEYLPIMIRFTSTTTADLTQELILSKLNRQKSNSYGPPEGKLALVFIDDLNMPRKEIYGAQPALEALRQFLDYKFWYRKGKITVENLLIMGTLGALDGSHQNVYSRFLRHFSLFSVATFSDDITSKIFTNILQIVWKRNGFGNDVIPLITSIVSATLDLYSSIVKSLFPTIKTPHYVFNIRDIFKVVSGCLLLKKDSAEDKVIFAKLWIHEVSRVFYDRLVNDDDREWLYALMKNNMETYFKEDFNEVFADYADENGTMTRETFKKFMFGTYLDSESETEKKYEEVPSLHQLYEKATNVIDQFNSENDNKMDIVLFQYALEHLSKICRVLSIPETNTLSIGISGSGRQTLIRLASLMMEKILFQPEISNEYNIQTWRADVKNILKQLGGKSKEIVLLVTEEQIFEDSLLEDIDSLLNSGEMPDLFEIDEKQDILELVRLEAQGGNRNLDINPLQVMEYFRSKCKSKLHICLCLSPVSPTFRKWLRTYSSLVNCCTIDWYDDWPEDALEKVAYYRMENVNLPQEIKLISIGIFKYFHMDATKIFREFHKKNVRKTYITSASFLQLINLFAKLVNEKQNEITIAKQRYLNGLEKINMASDAVSDMQRELNELKPQLITMAIQGAEMMEEIERETIEANKATVQVREDEKIANEQAAAAQVLKKDCEADLASAIPILESAISDLNTLKPTDITLVKSMKNPPAAIKLVMAAVCVMKSIPPDRIPDPSNPGRKMMDFWGPSKRLLGDMGFLQSLKEYDKDNIPAPTMLKIRREYLPHKDFKPHIVAKASTAAKGLCNWIIAMDKYDAIAKIVAPKKAKLQAAEAEFAATMAILDEKKAIVARLEKKLADLHIALEEANLKKQLKEEQVELCINKLRRAEKLFGGLGGEKKRWTMAAENLQILYDNLTGDLILSCGILAYLSALTFAERYSIVSQWKDYVQSTNIPFSEDFLLRNILGVESKIQNWYMFGLPRDPTSTENAIMQDISLRWPLFIDPQGQANKWIKQMEKANNLHILKISDRNYIATIRRCLEDGSPVLIENILEDIEIAINPILKKSGKSPIKYNTNFRLYMTTNLKNPHYLPEICNKVTLINFAISKDSLEDQLLGIVVAKERPDLQEKRERLIKERAENSAALQDVENTILKTLQETKGDILEDEVAIEALDSSKLLSIEILKKRDYIKESEVEINDFRNSYHPVARHTAAVYYCIVDLSNIDPMYQYSLSWFMNLYKFSIEMANKSKDQQKRIQFIKDTFTYNLYCNITRSLFEKDKLTFSFILCSKIMLHNGEIDPDEFDYFLSKVNVVKDENENPTSWLPNDTWKRLCGIKNFALLFTENESTWKNIYDSLEPQEEIFPEPWNTEGFPFGKLLMIRLFRPDKLADTIIKFVKENMGDKFVNPPPFDISKSYVESNCLIPLIFILSSGSDPIGALIKFSARMGFGNKLNHISLGQGQGFKAGRMIEDAQTEGAWVCLQNCHLATSWMTELESIYENINLTNTDISFRLWLTSYSTDKFPRSILETGIKMTNEPPTQLKKNIVRLYMSEPLNDSSFFEGCPGKDKTFSKLLYSVCFFHAVLQERKKFGAVGWNTPYSFDNSDFQISVFQLQNLLNRYEDVPYAALSYLIGECNYGGRITDDWDRRLLVTILKRFIDREVVDNPKYQFSDINPEYSLPKRCEYQDYLKHIDEISSMIPSDVFGLHENANIYRNYSTSAEMIESLITVYKQNEAGKDVEYKDDEIIDKFNVILEKLSFEFRPNESCEMFPANYYESLNTFYIQEIKKYTTLIKTIKSSINYMLSGVKGYILMTDDMEDQIKSIVSGKVPDVWKKVSYLTLKPLGAYIEDLAERMRVLSDWIRFGKPERFWISGYFSARGFLTAGMQNYARNRKIPIDELTFECVVVEEGVSERDEFDLYIYGPFFDGARWNYEQRTLDEECAKKTHEPMPTVKLFPIRKTDFKEGCRYVCPVYTTSDRRGFLTTSGHSSNYVFSLLLPTRKPPDHWTVRSAAIILQND